MNPNAPAVTLDELLAHRRWVRALARSLLADPQGADDIEQQVWMAAIERPPRRSGNVRAWLARVARRRRVDQLRRDSRRIAHEARAPARRSVPPPDAVVGQAEMQAHVARAVLDLDEPYRSTILLRYLQERSAREIGELQGVPVETVRTRLGRGLGMLRGRLERELGPDPAGWRGALLPIAGLEATPKVAAGVGAVGLAPKAILAGTMLVLLVLAAGLLVPSFLDGRGEETPSAFDDRHGEPGDSASLAVHEDASLRGAPDASRAAPSRDPSAAEAAGERSLAGEAGTDTPATFGAATAGVRPGAPVAPGVVAGRVLNDEHQPLAHAVILLALPPGQRVVAHAETDEDGRFRLADLEDRAYLLTASVSGRAPRRVSIRPGRQALEIVMRRSETIAGQVVAETSGEPVLGVLVSAVEGTGGAGAHRVWTRTNDEGRFALGGLPEGSWSLVVGAPGGTPASLAEAFIETRVGPVEAGREELRIELRRGYVIEGVIQGPNGDLWTAGAQVRVLPVDATGRGDYAGRRYVEATDDGSFRITGLARGHYDLTVDPKAGGEETTPASLAYVPGVAAGTTGLLVNLVVGRPLAGRLVDEQGDPVTAEGWIYVSPTGRPTGGSGSVQATLLEGGRFRTTPLDPGAAWDVRTGGFTGYGSVRLEGVALDGGDLEIVLPRGLQIAGRVVDAAGRPAPRGVPVVVMLPGRRPSSGPLQPWEYGFVNTDDEGAFRVTGLKELAYTVSAGGSTSGFLGVPKHGIATPVDDLVLRVERGVVLSGRVVDAQGDGVPFVTIYARSDRFPVTLPLTRTRRDGSFAFAGVPRGRLRITTNLDAQSIELGEVAAPATDVTLTVPE